MERTIPTILHRPLPRPQLPVVGALTGRHLHQPSGDALAGVRLL